ncbi:hypothetical protein BCON_0101g00150 [Botryotinia convoluta]|uniref:Uncharacterized protein n=1 Tax=Botryotinia convoluta TaxID=54673 RepID=A0A4Z1IDL7_9HELO|nr:hypothetical protein BCON_0101g00150 [Botryotinia convoluta]
MDNRTYLWLHLIMDVIRKRIESSRDSGKIDESLRSLPETVEKIYEEILNKSPYRSETEKLLYIVVGAERPLNTDEINVAMNIGICYDATHSFNDIHLENNERYPGMIRNLCGLRFGTALSLAVEDKRFEMAILLLQKGADASIECNPHMRKLSLLEDAVHAGELVVAQLLLQNQAVDKFVEGVSNTALDWAVKHHKTEMFKVLLESALRFALLVEMLLKFGASPTYKVAGQWTAWSRSSLTYVLEPLSDSSHTNSYKPEVVLELLLLKAEPLPHKTLKELLVKYLSKSSDESNLVRLLLNHPRCPEIDAYDYGSSVVFAALYAHIKSMELLMNETHDINSCRETIPWVTKLHSPKGTLGGCVWLEWRPISKGWFTRDIEITALFGGIISANECVVESLIDHGADVNMTIELGTSLFIAAALSSKSVVQLLFRNGAQITSCKVGERGQSSPLVIAAARGNIEIVELLLESGAQVEQGTAVIVHSILAYKEDIEGKFCPSAIEATEMEGHEDVVALLQEYRVRQAVTGVEEVEVTMMPSRIEEVEG